MDGNIAYVSIRKILKKIYDFKMCVLIWKGLSGVYIYTTYNKHQQQYVDDNDNNDFWEHCSSTIPQNVILEFQNSGGWYKANSQCHSQNNFEIVIIALIWKAFQWSRKCVF